MLRIITKYFFYFLILSPFWGYLLRGVYKIQIAVTSFFGVISIFICLLLLIGEQNKTLKIPKYLFFGFLFALYYTIWGFFNGKLEEDGPAKFFIANPYLLVLFVLIVIENTKFSEKFIKKIIFLIKITIIAACIVSIYQLLFDPFFFMPQNVSEDVFNVGRGGKYNLRIQSIFSYLDQNDLGLSFIPLLAIFVGYHFYSYKQNVFFICFIILAGLVCFLSNGRYVMINYILIFGQLLFLKQLKFGTKIKYVFGFILIFVFILISMVYVGYDLFDFYQERIMSESGTSRIIAFEMFGQFFLDNPFFGVGGRTTDSLVTALYGRSSQIHVGYLSALFEYGLVGAVLLFIFWYRILKCFYQRAKKSVFFGAFIGFSTFLVANLVLVQYSIFYYGIILCFVFSKYYYNKEGYEDNKDFICI